jgi:ParB family transcriptional regulator, chromosome partitioning protein
MGTPQAQKIEMLPLGRISVTNPRSRNKRTHREIVDNIEAIGLKRPITVSLRQNSDRVVYDLVCGEGRLEAFKMLGATEIPAIVIEAPEADCFVMSLVENIARRQHRPLDIMHEVGSLKKRGYSDAQIAQKIGVTANWVNMIVFLLENGEERLVASVETGLIPLSFAISIARADYSEVQNVLMDGYAAGIFKGKKLNVVRRMLDQRMKSKKGYRDTGFGIRSAPRKITPADLMRVYQREADKQRLLIKKSDFTQAKLLFIVEVLKDVFSEERFTTLLRNEHLDTMPRALAARIRGETLG